MADPQQAPTLDGGCACSAVRYRLLREPMFVHCCHCTRCQRENGAPFAHHAMVEFTQMQVLKGEPAYVKVPTDSGNTHWVVRCPSCQTAMWNEHGSRRAVTRYLRVGTLDEPGRCPPQAHIFLRSKQAWLELPNGAGAVPGFAAYYNAAKTWPAASLARYEQARKAKQAAAGKAR
jgi:hypothetical protein